MNRMAWMDFCFLNYWKVWKDLTVSVFGDVSLSCRYHQALVRREGSIIPFVTTHPLKVYCMVGRHICIDTIATGGNAQLLAGGI